MKDVLVNGDSRQEMPFPLALREEEKGTIYRCRICERWGGYERIYHPQVGYTHPAAFFKPEGY